MKRKQIDPDDDDDDDDEIDDASPFDEHGILRDGATYRVSMTMRDGLPPPTGKLAMYDVPPGRTAADSQPVFDASRHQPGFRDSRSVEQLDALERAYREADEIACNAWRGDQQTKPAGAYPLSAGAGSQCTINGQDGRLVREGDWLVCKPNKATDAMPVQDERERAYAEYDEYMRTAYLGAK
jgi:hypothetical protein